VNKLEKKRCLLIASAQTSENKNVNPATKMNDLLNGHIQKRRVKCGKPNCKCAKGEPHTAYYRVWHTDGKRYQRFVRQSEVENVRRACESHRQLQIKLRQGRAEHKKLLVRIRELLKEF
jgi:hypothetical protein